MVESQTCCAPQTIIKTSVLTLRTGSFNTFKQRNDIIRFACSKISLQVVWRQYFKSVLVQAIFLPGNLLLWQFRRQKIVLRLGEAEKVEQSRLLIDLFRRSKQQNLLWGIGYEGEEEERGKVSWTAPIFLVCIVRWWCHS